MAMDLTGGSVVLSLSSDPTSLISVLSVFQKLKVQIEHLESRQCFLTKKEEAVFTPLEYYVKFKTSQDVAKTLINELEKISLTVKLSSTQSSSPPSSSSSSSVWFPRHISDLYRCCTTLFKYGSELASDHPGYGDTEYVQRRREIAEISKNFKYGDKIPHIDFTETEIYTWGEVFRNQTRLYPTHACREYNTHFPALFAECGYREDNIPQLDDVSRYLMARTGWQLWPVIGWISSRDFLNALAFRVFPTAQYIRHHSSPLYTPEPDICHELMGHAPLFCDSCFAQFSQEIGLASLGISDEWINKLASLYWYTVEFGMVKEDGCLKAYGAGLLSSCRELQYCITDAPKHQDLVIEKAIATSYPATGLQPLYFIAETLNDMKKKLMDFSRMIPRDFYLRYDPYSQCVRVLDNEQVKELAEDL